MLLEEIAVLGHAGEFGSATQLHFAPAPTHLWRAQGVRQARGFALQRITCLLQLRDLRGERTQTLQTLALQFLRLLLIFSKSLREGRHQARNRGLPRFQFSAGGIFQRPEFLFGEGEETGIVLGQSVMR